MEFTNPLLWALLAGCTVLGYVVRLSIAKKQGNNLEQRLAEKTEEAKKKSEALLQEAKEKSLQILEEARTEEKETKEKLEKSEERLLKREDSLEKQLASVSEKEATLETKKIEIEELQKEAEEKRNKAVEQFEKIAGLTEEQAREQIITSVKDQYQDDLTTTIQKMERDRRDEIEKKASEIITTSLMRYARTHVADATTNVFNLPSEDLKGKIIGREGRNIKALERATGVDIIVDETPQSIIISSFDPLRREIAHMTLEKLLKDGRIQPAKIEEKVSEAKTELIKRMQKIGEDAAMEVGVVGFSKEILQLLGRLHFRTSYGQNVLIHSIEMGHIAGMIAKEVGANVDIAKKGALVHDIGKAISHEVEGTHVELGRKILAKYGVEDAVIKAMESHHEDYPFSTPESYIVTAADILSAGRPGARRDSVEQYIKRLQDLEALANGFEGVKQAYALSAGREIRVFVVPERIDDFGALQLAKNIATKAQTELKYPGEIKVNVIREMRAVEYAR